MPRRHWLVEIAAGADPVLADGLDLAPDIDVAQAWGVVGAALGIQERELGRRVAETHGLPIAHFASPQAAALKLLPAAWARRHNVLPLHQSDSRIIVASADPLNLHLEEEIRFTTGRDPQFAVAGPEQLAAEIAARYSSSGGAEALLEGLDKQRAMVTLETPEVLVEPEFDEVASSPVVKLTGLILGEAVQKGASDVHISANAKGGVVRYRIDGVLTRHLTLPLEMVARVIARIKVLGALDIADRLRPQDGRAQITVNGQGYDLRISTVPTRGYEKAVIRVLDPTTAVGLEGLNLPEGEARQMSRLLDHREGIILVTGPTGSGKTTTLYAVLRHLATEEVNVMTVEDPVEYELAGVTQIQVEPAQDVTFASALRAILRQDPDIILVGEIRDRETAEIAVQAAMTGHLVLATLHTNDAVGVVRRLTDLGLDAPSVADTLRGAVAQRLVRRVCPHCATAPTGELSASERKLQTVYRIEPRVRIVGCSKCDEKGYRGRMAIMEYFMVDEKIESLIAQGQGHVVLVAEARQRGMRDLLDSGLTRVAAGDTTLEEVERVVGVSDEPAVGSEDGAAPDISPGHAVSIPAVPPPLRPVYEPVVPAPQPVALIVDDRRVDRRLMSLLLGKMGFRLMEADDGIAALEVLRSHPVDLVISDLQMPRMDGHELLAAIRSDAALSALPVIVQSATPDPAWEARLITAGADDYVRKPPHPARFIARVSAVMRRAAAEGRTAASLETAA